MLGTFVEFIDCYIHIEVLMKVFIYGSLCLPEVQRVLFSTELTSCPYILKGYKMYANEDECCLSPTDFGLLRGEIAEVTFDRIPFLDSYMQGYAKVNNEDGVLIYEKQEGIVGTEVSWEKGLVYEDIQKYIDKASACVDSTSIRHIPLSSFKSFGEAMEAYKMCLVG